MSAIKHTPGPWEVGNEKDRHEAGSVYCDNTLGSRVAIVFGEHQKYSVFSREEERANARLIACAPEMLEALKQALEWFHEPTKNSTKWFEHDIPAIISKAEGRS